MHQQLTRELAMNRIADFHRQAAMYRLSSSARSTVDEPPEETPPATPLIARWALAGVLLSMLVVGGLGL